MPLLRKYPQNEDILCYFTYMQNTAQYVPRQKQKKQKQNLYTNHFETGNKLVCCVTNTTQELLH